MSRRSGNSRGGMQSAGVHPSIHCQVCEKPAARYEPRVGWMHFTWSSLMPPMYFSSFFFSSAHFDSRWSIRLCRSPISIARSPTLSDTDVCAIINGHFYGFEVKRPEGGRLSKLQELTIEKINAAALFAIFHFGAIAPNRGDRFVDFVLKFDHGLRSFLDGRGLLPLRFRGRQSPP